MIENFIFILNVVAPVFLLVVLGLALKKIRFINDTFVDLASKFVFNVSLPPFLFLKLYDADLKETFDVEFVLFNLIGTLLVFSFGWLASLFLANKPEDKGVFIQGSFRGNYAIVGFAIILQMFGHAALAKASIALVFLLPLYNLLAVIALTVPMNKNRNIQVKRTVLDIIKNPLIIGTLSAVPFSLFNIGIPESFRITGEHLSSIALPLALIGIGGSMNIEAIKKASRMAFNASLIKIIISPLILTSAAYLLGFRGEELGIIFVIFACPTAIASFVMTIAMGGNSKLAGNIIVISTLGSVVTFSLGLLILREFGLV